MQTRLEGGQKSNPKIMHTSYAHGPFCASNTILLTVEKPGSQGANLGLSIKRTRHGSFGGPPRFSVPHSLLPLSRLSFVPHPSMLSRNFSVLSFFPHFSLPSPILFRPLSLSFSLSLPLSNSPSLRIPWDERSVYAEGERGNRTDYRGNRIL